MQELTDEELLYASPEDWALYIDIIQGLPTREGKNGDHLDKFGVEIPYHSGPHILKHFRDVIEIVNPDRILEIGFNMGHSAAMWLHLSEAHVDSIDISKKDETIEAAGFLEKKYGKPVVRFEYFNRDLFWDGFKYYDLCFIDGAHDEQNIVNDINLCSYLKVPYLLFDDWYPRYGETQKAVVHFPELELVKDMNNLRLYKFNY